MEGGDVSAEELRRAPDAQALDVLNEVDERQVCRRGR
jgi:hypothetical protein